MVFGDSLRLFIMTFKIWQLIIILILHTTAAIKPYKEPPSIFSQPPHEQLYQVSQSQDERDKPFTLNCEASGTPEPTYRWIKNGKEFDYVSYDKRINQQPKRGTLVFTKPEAVDEGLYQCFAENSLGTSVSNSVFLRKSELNFFPDDEIKYQQVNEGDPLTLECNPPTGYPKPDIFWLIISNSGALQSINSSRLAVDPEGNLHFSNVTAEDSLKDGYYSCSASSFFRNEYKIGNKVSLIVENYGGMGESSREPTKQYFSPPKVVALRGQSIKLSCIFGGTPLPQIEWRRKGGSLSSSKYEYDQYGKTLVIKNIDFSDQGTYECTASNGVGRPKAHAMSVDVQAAPYWTIAPNNTVLAEDEMATFECSAKGYPEPRLQWFVNGIPIEKAKANPRRTIKGTILTIENLSKLDTAVYQCNASNIHGYAFRDFVLNVLALEPQIIERPEPLVKTVVTSTIILRCKVFGAPKPEVKWIKGEMQELTGGRYQVLEDGHLEIKDVLVTDKGLYTCVAKNKLGEARESGKLDVKGKTKIIQPPENFEVAATKSATFRCNAEADPSLELKIIWLFQGHPLDYDQDPRMIQANDNSLTITQTNELDSGIYTCLAETELDNAEAKATLIVQDVPNPPRVNRVQCDRFLATVEWQPMGDRRAPILSYIIQFNTSFTPDTWSEAFTDTPATDKQIKVPMSPWANYTFRVIARNKIGLSLPSKPSERCTTPTDVPYKNPDKVVGYGTEPDNLIISWAPMQLIEQNGPGFFYKIFWKREDLRTAIWENEKITNWEESQLLIHDTPTFKPYRIKVEAHNQYGQAHVTAPEFIGYSGEDVPLEAPTNFQVSEVQDATTALFTWNPVPIDTVRGHFKGYKIQTWTEGEGRDRLREVIILPNVTRSAVSVLRPNTNNLVIIFVFNERYQGPPSSTINLPTPEGVPGPVASFTAVPLGSNAFYLIWQKPSEPNGNLTGYRIYFSEVSGTDVQTKTEKQPPIVNPNLTRAKLGGLKSDTKYRLSIHATTSKGQGAEYFIEVRTNEESDIAPDVPDFTWTTLDNEEGKAAIKVIWMPAVEGSPGSHFYVQYKRKGENRWESTDVEKYEDTTIVTGLELGTLYEVRVVAVDGMHHVPSKIEEIETGGVPIAAPEAADNVATAAWFIGMMCAIALLLLLLIIVCLIKRNRGGKYSVHEKELNQGHDIDYPDDGFNEYHKPQIDNQNPRGSRMSLNSSLKGGESDTDSMAEYGEGETGKFEEDGSFIGQYGTKKKQQEPTSPSALATFV